MIATLSAVCEVLNPKMANLSNLVIQMLISVTWFGLSLCSHFLDYLEQTILSLGLANSLSSLPNHSFLFISKLWKLCFVLTGWSTNQDCKPLFDPGLFESTMFRLNLNHSSHITETIVYFKKTRNKMGSFQSSLVHRGGKKQGIREAHHSLNVMISNVVLMVIQTKLVCICREKRESLFFFAAIHKWSPHNKWTSSIIKLVPSWRMGFTVMELRRCIPYKYVHLKRCIQNPKKDGKYSLSYNSKIFFIPTNEIMG